MKSRLACAFALALSAAVGCNSGGTNSSGPSGEGGASAGAGTTLVTGLEFPPWHIVSDLTNIYWVSDRGPGIMSAPVTGGSATTVRSSTSISYEFLAVDATNVYFIESSVLYAMAKSGGTPAAISAASSSTQAATALDGVIYWVESSKNVNPGNSPATVFAMPLPQGQVRTIASFNQSIPVHEIGVTSTTIFVGTTSLEYFSTAAGLPEGGKPTLDQTAGACDAPVSSDEAIYCGTPGALNKIASDGTVTVLSAQENPVFLATDADSVYWIDNKGLNAAIVRKVSKQGGAVTDIFTGAQLSGLGVDDNAIYWADQSGAITRTPK